MPAGSEDADVGDERSDDTAETVESDDVGAHRPRDPVLVLVRAVERALRGIDRLYARLETLPGRVQFGFAVVAFVSSAYFGTTIKRAVDVLAGRTVATVLSEFMALSPGVRVVTVLVVVLVGQVAVANEKLTKIGEIVPDMVDDEAVTDGGVRTRHVDTTGAWAHGGAALGAGFGALFGYATIFGGMIFGAIVGNLAEEWSAKRRKRRQLERKVVSYLLREHVFAPESVETETVRNWFPADDSPFVTEALEYLLHEESPVVRASDGTIQLTNPSEAVAYLDRNGGRVPSEFAGPNRPQ
jgi:hypothetical protein